MAEDKMLAFLLIANIVLFNCIISIQFHKNVI